MAKSLDIFLDFKTTNSDLLHCIEETTDKMTFTIVIFIYSYLSFIVKFLAIIKVQHGQLSK